MASKATVDYLKFLAQMAHQRSHMRRSWASATSNADLCGKLHLIATGEEQQAAVLVRHINQIGVPYVLPRDYGYDHEHLVAVMSDRFRPDDEKASMSAVSVISESFIDGVRDRAGDIALEGRPSTGAMLHWMAAEMEDANIELAFTLLDLEQAVPA